MRTIHRIIHAHYPLAIWGACLALATAPAQAAVESAPADAASQWTGAPVPSVETNPETETERAGEPILLARADNARGPRPDRPSPPDRGSGRPAGTPPAAPVPEPATWIGMGSLLALILGVGWHRRRRSARAGPL